MEKINEEKPTIKKGSMIKFNKYICGFDEVTLKEDIISEVISLSDFEVTVLIKPINLIAYVDYNDIKEIDNKEVKR